MEHTFRAIRIRTPGLELAFHANRTEDDMTEMAGNPLIRESPDFRTMGRPKVPTTHKHPLKVLESQKLYIFLGRVIF